MSEKKSIFAYNDSVSICIEINKEKDINALRSFIRAGRFSDTDAAILKAVSVAGYANKQSIERYLALQTEYKVVPKKTYRFNINKLVDNGFLVRLYASYGATEKESPRIYCLSVAVCALLPHLFGQKKTSFRSGVPVLSACDVLSMEAGFQCFCSMLADPVFAGTDISVREKVALPSHVCLPAVSAKGKNGTCYVFVIRRLDSSLERAFFDAQALMTKLAADGTRGALLFVCEDALHMESVSAKLPSALSESGSALFCYDRSLLEQGSVVPYSVEAGIGSVKLMRVDLFPLSAV